MPQQNDSNGPVRLAKDLEANILKIKKAFSDTETLVVRRFENRYNPALQCCIVFTDGMVNNILINEYILNPVLEFSETVATACTLDFLLDKVLFVNEAKKTGEFSEITEAIVYGDTVLLANGCAEALLLNTKGWPIRGIAEPEGEKVLQGPREGFTEGLLTNLAMLRRKIKTPDLKFKYRTFGKETKTKACVCWIGRIARPEILEELNRRLDSFDLDGALDTNYIAEYIRDYKWSPFNGVGRTERPDVVAGKLLEGRIALFLDGTPTVMTLPYLMIENFQSNEDYYTIYWHATFYRILRIVAFFLAIGFPALYVAAVTTQQELLPTSLLLSIAVARHGVPFPTILEVFLMILMFEVLKETGLRMPSAIGQALSIVGALVVGQAAVEARIASAPVIIVVAATGITGLIIPRLSIAIVVLRTIFLLLAFVLGLFGLVMGFMGLLIYLLDLRSLGVSVFYNPSLRFQARKDTFMRASWLHMKTRPRSLSADPVRSGPEGKPEE